MASTTYERDSVEFTRTLSFTDGLFAIAITLLVIDLAVPVLHHDSSIHELADRLNDEKEKFISFFISFAVIGRYWIAHHTFFSQLARMDRPLIALNLLYLAFIAFLPFPTALLGEYFSNPLSVVIYAVTVAIVSGMEVVLFSRAQNHGLLEKKLPRDVYRYGPRCRSPRSSSSSSRSRSRSSRRRWPSAAGSSVFRSPQSPAAGSPRGPTSCCSVRR